MTRKSSKAKADGKAKAPKEQREESPVERFRSLEELNEEFSQQRPTGCGPSTSGFRSLNQLTKEFKQQVGSAKESRKQQQLVPKEAELMSPAGSSTGVLKKIFEGRGFGFVAPDQDHGAGDVFLHFSDISGASARSLGVGARVRYDVEPDASSGRLRAKNVSVLSSSAEPAVSSIEQGSESTTTQCRSQCPPIARAYSRDIMLGIFKALVAAPQSRTSRRPRVRITTVAVHPAVADDQEDPHLDDEQLLAMLEERLDKENGADAKNMETFGAISGWTYEEALAANAKLQVAQECEDSTFGGASTEPSASPHLSFTSAEETFSFTHASSEVSDASEDARNAIKDAEAYTLFADGKANGEFALLQSKLLEGCNHQEEPTCTPYDSALTPVFQ